MAYYPIDILDLNTLFRAIGVIGFLIYVAGFYGLCTGRLNSASPLYFVMVLLASTCVMASLWVDFNLSAAMIQGFYIVMSLGAIFKRWRQVGHLRNPPAEEHIHSA